MQTTLETDTHGAILTLKIPTSPPMSPIVVRHVSETQGVLLFPAYLTGSSRLRRCDVESYSFTRQRSNNIAL